MSNEENKENTTPQEENKENVEPSHISENGDENQSQENQEAAEEEEQPQENKKSDLIDDIMANNPIQRPDEQNETREFSKKDVIEEVGFSFLDLNVWLDAQFPMVPRIWKLVFEILFVTSAFLTLPFLTLYLEYGKDSLTELKGIFTHKNKDVDPLIGYLQEYVFLTISYIIYIIINSIAENILYIAITILTFIRIPIDGMVVELLQVIKATSYYSSMSLISLIIFFAYEQLVRSYKWFSSDRTVQQVAMSLLLWYSILMFILFIEKFFMNFYTTEIRRIEFRGRIWDVNYKTFIFKKLVAISTASPSERKELGETYESDYDPGFFLKHHDLRLNSEENAKNVAESIFAYLEIKKLSYEDIKSYFPSNYDEVYNYLSDKKFTEDEERPDLEYEVFEHRAITLSIERNDMSRTLNDRESIFNKLDLILVFLCLYFSLMILAILLAIDYTVYLASVGPFIFSLSWVFSDTIKEIYNCFVFLLIRHPYDVGDRVLVDNIEYIVQKTDLLSTTFIDVNNKLVYIPNPMLFGKKIENIRRSFKQCDTVTIKVAGSATFNSALELKDDIQTKLKEEKDFFTGLIYLLKFEGDGDNVALSYLIQHTQNFQKMQERYKRRDKLTNILEDALKSKNIVYKNSFTFVS